MNHEHPVKSEISVYMKLKVNSYFRAITQVILTLVAFNLRLATVFAQTVTFSSSTYVAGSGPATPAVADVYGNSTLDIICPIYLFNCANPGPNDGTGNTLVVLTNNDSGVFGSNATLTAGTGAIDVAAADVNGDSYVDLIVADRHTNTLTVLSNNGIGGFGGSATLAVGQSPSTVVAADLRGVGLLDLISANFGTNTLTLWFNNGRGGFISNATITVGNGPFGVAAADINGDGHLDLISANYNDNTLTVLTNNGSGGFGLGATLSVGNEPVHAVAADLNGDGKLDLISVNFADNSLTLLTNDGRGRFAVSATLVYSAFDPSTAGGVANSVAVGDFTGHGYVDLVCAIGGPGCAGGNVDSIMVLTNNGSGIFGYNTTIKGIYKPTVVAADVNADGRMDIVATSYLTDGTVAVLLNTTTYPSPSQTPKLTASLQGVGVRVAWPSKSPGWELQETRSLTKPSWLPSGYGGWPITDDGTNKSLTEPVTTSNLFFRLLHH